MRALVLVGHGSRRAAGNEAVHVLAGRIAARFDLPVHVGFIELAGPGAAEAIDRAVAAGATEVVVVPAVLLAAGHAKNDLPVLVHQARSRHPAVRIVASPALGVHPGMLQVLRERLAAARRRTTPWEDDAVGVVLLGRGSSDPDANADVYKLGRLLVERQGLRGHEIGFVGVTRPDLPTAFRRLAARRPRLIVILPYLLHDGVLVERVRDEAARLRRLVRRVEVEVADPVGTHDGTLDVLQQRVEEAVNGTGTPACDTCKYRTPLPGFAHELGGRQALRKACAHVELPATPDQPAHTHRVPRAHVLVCVNRDCVDRGSLATLDRLRRRIRRDGQGERIRTTRVMCVGRCGEGPAVCVYPDGVWYRGVDVEAADRIYEQHLLGDRPVGHLIDQVLGGA